MSELLQDGYEKRHVAIEWRLRDMEIGTQQESREKERDLGREIDMHGDRKTEEREEREKKQERMKVGQ